MVHPVSCLVVILTSCILRALGDQSDQTVLTEQWQMHDNTTGLSDTRVAIIGGGITGSSAAWKLHRLLTSMSQSVHIDIFEASNRLGGQILSIENPDNHRQSIELGAFTFADTDLCINKSRIEVGLQSFETYPYVWKGIGIWDTVELRNASSKSHCNWSGLPWSDQARLVWRYGWRVRRLHEAMQEVLATWTLASNLPVFHSISDMLKYIEFDQGLLEDIEQYLRSRGFPSTFIQDYSETCARVSAWTLSNQLTALRSIISMNTNRPFTISGGNVGLVQRLISQSHATVRLNTNVTTVRPGSQRRYSIEFTGRDTDQPSPEYDIVIIAAPFHKNDIDLNLVAIPNPLVSSIQGSRDDLWVSIVVTSESVAPAFFGLAENTSMPDDIYTNPPVLTSGDFNTSIFSITRSVHRWLDLSCKFDWDCDQFNEANCYRILSRVEPKDDILQAMFGLSATSKTIRSEGGDFIKGIHWVRRQKWPAAIERNTQERLANRQGLGQNFKLTDGLYYAGGGDQLVNSVEMGCRMGNNIARLVYEDFRPNS